MRVIFTVEYPAELFRFRRRHCIFNGSAAAMDAHRIRIDFDTVEFGENGHFAANLAPETMWIDFFFFLTGSSGIQFCSYFISKLLLNY